MPMTLSLKKAAIALQSLPKPQASQIMARMEPEDLRSVFQAIDRLDVTTAKQIFEALDDLAREAEKLESYRKPVELEQSHAQVCDNLHQLKDSYRDSPFEFLIGETPDALHQLIRDEHPKYIATVLAHLPPEISSEQIRKLEPVFRMSVIKRMCEVPVEVTAEDRELAYSLKMRWNKSSSRIKTKNSNGLAVAAQVLALSDEATREEILTRIGQNNPTLQRELKTSVVEFDAIADLNDQDIKTLLKNTDTSFWAPALKASTTAVRTKILNNMAPKAAQVLSQEIERLGNLPNTIAEQAQLQIMKSSFLLKRSGLICENQTAKKSSRVPNRQQL